MKEEVWAYLLNDEDNFQEVSSERLRRFLERPDSRTFAEFGGKFVRLAVIYISQDRKEAKRVAAIGFRRCKLTRNGSLDPKFREKRKNMTAELASIQPRKKDLFNVTDHSDQFEDRRRHNDFSWTPTVSMVQKLSVLVQQRTEGTLGSREVMYQILSLTATA